MKIAVYTIALNEEQFLEKWYESAKDADYLLIADTGSADSTVEKAKELGINVVSISVKPWRFDVARNASLAYIPADIDYCIALDMDEILIPGWRKKLEGMLEKGITRPRYKYTWSWNADGTPGLQYGGDKVHARHGYVWKHPVHEVIVADRINEVQEWTGLEIHHHPDNSKSRGQYLPLLELSVKEDPLDDRNAYYYARELFFVGEYEKAKEEFKRHLSLPKAVWKPERAASMRYIAKCDLENKEYWLNLAIEESPGRREPLVELATLHYENKEWQKCIDACLEALKIKEKPLDYLCEEFAWGYVPYDLLAISYYQLKLFKEALTYGELAVVLNKKDKRLLDNLEFYKLANN
jgi:glycosyltransferase involved in cell wall biosynthesis